MNHAQRQAVAVSIVSDLGAELRAGGHGYEEVVCVLLHALHLAETIGTATEHRSALRPAGVPTTSQVIAACKTELGRRAG